MGDEAALELVDLCAPATPESGAAVVHRAPQHGAMVRARQVLAGTHLHVGQATDPRQRVADHLDLQRALELALRVLQVAATTPGVDLGTRRFDTTGRGPQHTRRDTSCERRLVDGELDDHALARQRSLGQHDPAARLAPERDPTGDEPLQVDLERRHVERHCGTRGPCGVTAAAVVARTRGHRSTVGRSRPGDATRADSLGDSGARTRATAPHRR